MKPLNVIEFLEQPYTRLKVCVKFSEDDITYILADKKTFMFLMQGLINSGDGDINILASIEKMTMYIN